MRTRTAPSPRRDTPPRPDTRQQEQKQPNPEVSDSEESSSPDWSPMNEQLPEHDEHRLPTGEQHRPIPLCTDQTPYEATQRCTANLGQPAKDSIVCMQQGVSLAVKSPDPTEAYFHLHLKLLALKEHQMRLGDDSDNSGLRQIRLSPRECSTANVRNSCMLATPAATDQRPTGKVARTDLSHTRQACNRDRGSTSHSQCQGREGVSRQGTSIPFASFCLPDARTAGETPATSSQHQPDLRHQSQSAGIVCGRTNAPQTPSQGGAGTGCKRRSIPFNGIVEFDDGPSAPPPQIQANHNS